MDPLQRMDKRVLRSLCPPMTHLPESRNDVCVRAAVAPHVARDVDAAVEDRDPIAKDLPDRLSLPKVPVAHERLD